MKSRGFGANTKESHCCEEKSRYQKRNKIIVRLPTLHRTYPNQKLYRGNNQSREAVNYKLRKGEPLATEGPALHSDGLAADLRLHSHLSGGLRLTNYSAVAENHKFSSRSSILACFCSGHSNRVRRLKRELSNLYFYASLVIISNNLCFYKQPIRRQRFFPLVTE